MPECQDSGTFDPKNVQSCQGVDSHDLGFHRGLNAGLRVPESWQSRMPFILIVWFAGAPACHAVGCASSSRQRMSTIWTKCNRQKAMGAGSCLVRACPSAGLTEILAYCAVLWQSTQPVRITINPALTWKAWHARTQQLLAPGASSDVNILLCTFLVLIMTAGRTCSTEVLHALKCVSATCSKDKCMRPATTLCKNANLFFACAPLMPDPCEQPSTKCAEVRGQLKSSA